MCVFVYSLGLLHDAADFGGKIQYQDLIAS